MPHYAFTLKEKKVIAKETMSFVFEFGDKEFNFKPGQFIDISIEDPKYKDDKGNVRAFSIASSPLDNYLMIASRLTDSAMKKSLAELEIGSLVHVDGPLGSFKLHSDKKVPVVIITGGIGITPFRSIIKTKLKIIPNKKLF